LFQSKTALPLLPPQAIPDAVVDIQGELFIYLINCLRRYLAEASA